ncbi:MAG TPA: YwiC-like family protein [Pyrinomonadaceae bacterium]|nr:YwiC-like family protein [Pyrinomonadaceae bacterium]
MMSQVTRFRAVALPPEHGGWALIIEPIVLGLLVAPSMVGLFISLAALACFLARHPIKVAIGDRRRKRLLQRTSLADRFALLYVTLAVVFFSTAVGITADRGFLLPLVIALPLIVIQLLYDVRGQSRKAIPEILGALAVGSISTAIALAAGWSKATAYALWIIIACRHVPTILYLRVLLNRRREKQRPMVNGTVVVVQVLALIAIIVLLFFKIAPASAILVFAILFIRAVVGLFNHRAPTPKQLGISEIIFGAFAVLMVYAGYLLGW